MTHPVVARILGLTLAVAVAALAGACQSFDPPQPGFDPSVRALQTPAVALPPAAPADPHVDHALDSLDVAFVPRHPGQVPSAPWEVVLRYPPEVEAKVLARWEQHSRYRDTGDTVVFLNFNGVTINVDNDSNALTNTSWVPDVSGSTVTIPAFNSAPYGSDRASVIASIVSRMEQLFAGYNIVFTTTRPSSGNYMMTVIGGSAATIGMEQGVLGVSPLDCQPGENLNLNPLDINFICSVDIASYTSSLWDLVYTIAHENGHTYGLAHINREEDIMFWASGGSSTLTWGAASTRSGEGNCSLNNYQDDRVYLTKSIGGAGANPEQTAPTVSITSPANNATVQSGFTVAVNATDASGIKKVEIYVNGTLKNYTASAPYQFTMLGMTPATYQLQAKAIDYFDNVGSSGTVSVTIPSSQPPVGCQSSSECGANQTCQNNKCIDNPPVPTLGALGADCSRNEDCNSGWCIFGEQNYCTQSCNEAQNLYCPVGFACSPDGFCLSEGPIPPGATGASCSQNVQCRSGICVSGENNGFCSAVCQPNGDACPNRSPCVDSGDGQTYICDRPPVATSDGGVTKVDGGAGGCAVAGEGGALAFAPLALLVLLGARRRRATPVREVRGGY